MPTKRLSLLVPNQGVRNRNAKVERRYEASCRQFEKDYKIAMRGHRTLLADDLQFGYYLLKQMEKYEDEKLIKKNVVVRCSYKIPAITIDLGGSRPSTIAPQTDRPGDERVDDVITPVRPLTAPAGRNILGQTAAEKKNIVRRYGRKKPRNGPKKRSKPTRTRSAPVPLQQEEAGSGSEDEDDQILPSTPLARFTRTYEYNRKVLLCRSRQERRRIERIKGKGGDAYYDDDSNYGVDEDDDEYILLEEVERQETRKHNYWVWKIDVLFEKWRRNDRELDDDDIYSLYEEDLNEEVFDDNQVQSYLQPGIRQVNTSGRGQLVQFTRNKVLKYRWAFAGERFKKGAEDTRKSRRKFIRADLNQHEKQKIRAEAETKCLKLKRMVQESDFLRNEVYDMAPFYKTKQAIIAKIAARQPALFE